MTERTLSDADIEAIAQRVVALLAGRLGALESKRIEPDAIYSVAEAAAKLGVSGQVIRAHLRSRILAGKRVTPRVWQIRGSELLKLA